MKQDAVVVAPVKSQFTTETILAKSSNYELVKQMRSIVLSNFRFLWICIFRDGENNYTLTANNDFYGRLKDSKVEEIRAKLQPFIQEHKDEISIDERDEITKLVDGDEIEESVSDIV